MAAITESKTTNTNTMNIVKLKTLDVSKVRFGTPRTNSSGKGKSIAVTYEGRSLVLQTSLTPIWDPSDYDGDQKFVMQLRLRQETEDCIKLKELWNHLLDTATSNSKSWFGRKGMSREAVEMLMWPMLRYPKDKQTGEMDYDKDPTLKTKLPNGRVDGQIDPSLFDFELFEFGTSSPLYLPTKPRDYSRRTFEQQEAINTALGADALDVMRKSSVVAVIQCGGVYLSAGKGSISWRLRQALVRRRVNFVGQATCMILADEDDELISKQLAEEEEEEEDDEVEESPTFEDDSDDEDVAAAVAQEVKEEVVAKPKKKKVVRRKKKVTVDN